MGKKMKKVEDLDEDFDKEIETNEETGFSLDSSKILIDANVMGDIMHLINKSDFEVSGLGIVEREGINFRVTKSILLHQENGSTSTEIDGKAVCRAMHEFRGQAGHIGQMRWWWHSHVDMKVFMSSTDEETLGQLGKSGWFLATVFNKRKEMLSTLYMNEPIGLIVNNVETEIDYSISEDRKNELDKEYDEKVKIISNAGFGRRISDDDFEYDKKTRTYKYAGDYDYGGYGLGHRKSVADWFASRSRKKVKSKHKIRSMS